MPFTVTETWGIPTWDMSNLRWWLGILSSGDVMSLALLREDQAWNTWDSTAAEGAETNRQDDNHRALQVTGFEGEWKGKILKMIKISCSHQIRW